MGDFTARRNHQAEATAGTAGIQKAGSVDDAPKAIAREKGGDIENQPLYVLIQIQVEIKGAGVAEKELLQEMS